VPLSKSAQRALVLCPHPDDESLGCGGTLKTITSTGGIVDVLYMTRGENGSYPRTMAAKPAREELAAIRTEEAKRACEILGVRNVFFLNGHDGSLKTQPELSDAILGTLTSSDYRSVFSPWPYDAHHDHGATYWMLQEALRRYSRNLDIWLYEVWAPLPHNICIAIDKTIEAKMTAFRTHESQLSNLNYAEAFYGLAKYRSLFCPPAQFAEAFFNCERTALLNHENVPWPQVTRQLAMGT